MKRKQVWVLVLLLCALLGWGIAYYTSWSSNTYRVTYLSEGGGGVMDTRMNCYIKASNLQGEFIEGIGRTNLCSTLTEGDIVYQNPVSGEITK